MDNKIFRGNGKCPAVEEINKVAGLEIKELLEKSRGANGEQDLYIFPARAQVTWFRAKHEKGLIDPQVVYEDAYRARVQASVYDEKGNLLAVGHGTCAHQEIPFKYVEAAVTNAVRQALELAGFGCQLTAKTFEDVSFEQPTPVTENTPNDGMPTMPGEQPAPAANPDAFNTSKKVSANKHSGAVDVNEKTEKLKGSRRQRNKGTSTGAIPENQAAEATSKGKADPPSEESTPLCEAPATGEETSAVSDGVSGPLPEVQIAESAAGESPAEPSDGHDASDGATADLESLDPSVEELVMTAVAAMPDFVPDEFDNLYFGDKVFNPQALYINRTGVETGVTNSQMQKALRFFAENPVLALDVTLHSNDPEKSGQPLRVLLEQGKLGWSFLWAVVARGAKESLPFLAACLFCFCNTTEESFPTMSFDQ